MQITFFHDVLCPFCYVTNKRLRKIVSEYKDVHVKHKAFMIISSLEDLEAAAPTPEDARELFKSEFSILTRYFPDYDPKKVLDKGKIGHVWSLPPLMACKAAEFQKGDEGHWEYFSRAQDKFFMEGENVNDDQVLISIAEEIGLDVERFKRDFKSKEAKLAVIQDEEEAKAMGIKGVPALLVNEKWLIRGVQSEEYLKQVIDDVLTYGEPKKIELKAYWEQ
ncbi:DsbA family oxidoreductase [Metallosphaera hakonensis]|uniref:Disulfide bond formation protein DsbA n=1 Tax=Metallosphaera hakonensis JCM 8857 = DSM 7519 TaxID=1293036 RepID=A0A2U9IW41_9CREN|nr:DsbA family protein [Metallosphaera hakonensis]AWS00183.1 thioredoxin domain-containing protein [Metallosphaera hakonensis JCM 8857 = DSM 7519]